MPATTHTRRRSAPPAPSSPASPSASTIDDEATKTERDDVERRRNWLLKLPQLYTRKHRERYVFLNLDNTAASLAKSPLLYCSVDGATCPHDVRLHFEALTNHLCGASTSAVVAHQLATYSKTNSHVAQALKKFGWTTKTTGNDDKVLQTELLKQLQKGAATANGKTLVLAMGGGNLGTGNTSAFQDIISKFLVEGWHIEIHAWLRALNDGYIRFQSENPGRVAVIPLDDVIHDIVFLKKTKRSSAGVKHVCSVLSQNESPLKVVTRPVPESAVPETACNTSSPSQRVASVSPILKHAHSVPPATSPNASWIKAAMQGHQATTNSPASTSSSTSTSSSSHSNDFTGPASFIPSLPRSESAPPRFPLATASMQSASTSPLPPLPPLGSSAMNAAFNSPFLPTPTQPAYRWMLWELQLQQMRDLISAQQTDLAMRQCALQQTTELMRLMQDQERMWQPASGTYQQPNSPWNDTWGGLTYM